MQSPLHHPHQLTEINSESGQQINYYLLLNLVQYKISLCSIVSRSDLTLIKSVYDDVCVSVFVSF